MYHRSAKKDILEKDARGEEINSCFGYLQPDSVGQKYFPVSYIYNTAEAHGEQHS